MKAEETFGIHGNWAVALHALGVSKSDLLRRASLPEDLFERDEPRLSTSQFFTLWGALEQSVDEPAFPLALSEGITGEIFAPCMFSALCSPNLGVALERLDIYKRLTVPISLLVGREGPRARVEVRWLLADAVPPATLIATELVYLVRIARLATRERVCPVAVESQRPLEPVSVYEAWLGVRPTVSAHNAITFRTSDLELPFLTHNAGLWRVFEGDLRRRLADLDRSSTMTQKTRAVLLQALPSGLGTLDEVAHALHLSTRTLQRRLREEGSSFKEVLQKTRQSLAEHYLLRTNISASEVGFLLGFDDPSSFFRAYSAWTGTTPESTRRRAQLHE